ncbi:MAG: phage tail protein [Bacteroidales bacterium]|nr:phage tail protein [Bacteroidales bacterium]
MAGYYPPPGFHFKVDFSDISGQENDALFQSVSGLNVEMETETYREGGENRFEHVFPVKTKYSNLVLKRGLLLDSDVINWCLDTFQTMEVYPIDLVVSLLNDEHQPLLSWNIVHAWPLKWNVDDMNATESKIFVETLEFSYQYYTLLS